MELQSCLTVNGDKKSDLAIHIVSRETYVHGGDFVMLAKDLDAFVDVLESSTEHFQLSFNVQLEKKWSLDFLTPFTRFVRLLKNRYCVLNSDIPVTNSSLQFLMKSKIWNFVNCVDCKWDSDCPHCRRLIMVKK